MDIFIFGLAPSLPFVQERRIPASQNKCETGNSLAFSVREYLDHNAQHRKMACYRPGTFSGCRPLCAGFSVRKMYGLEQ